MHRLSIILILLLCIAAFAPIEGQTILSSRGVGSPVAFPNARAMGMGGISVAVTNPISFSLTNPASMHKIRSTRLVLQYFYEHNDYEASEGTASSSYSNFNGFHFFVPLGSGIGLATGLSPLTRTRFDLAYDDSLAGEHYTKSIEGRGGVNSFSLAICISLRSNLSIGVSGQYLFGQLKESWQVIYDNPYFIRSKDTFSTKSSGFNYKLGIIYQPFTPILLGAIWSPEKTLDYSTQVAYFFENAGSHDGTATLPETWGAGITFITKKFGELGFEFQCNNWSKTTLNGIQNPETHSTQHFSVGWELNPTRNPAEMYFKRIAYRLGFSTHPYHVRDLQGNKITETWISAGLGFPMMANASQVDVALLAGQRGSFETNGLGERLFRISVTITGGERWFMRRY